jgi:hypothetical protein
MAAIGNSFFWLINFKKSSPLKPLGQVNRNLIGSVYGRSSIKIAHFIPICKQTWQLLFEWSISKKSSHLKPLGQMNWNFLGSILGRSCIKIANLFPIRLQIWPPQAILVSYWSISKKAKWTETWNEASMESPL